MREKIEFIVKAAAWVLILLSLWQGVLLDMTLVKGIDNDLTFITGLLALVWVDLQEIKGALK